MAESPDDPGVPPGEEPGREPIGALPAAPVPRPSESGWQINWWGFVPLAVVAALAFVGFRALGLGDDDPAQVEAAGGRVERTSTSLRPRPTTTTAVAATTTTVAAVTTAPTTTVPAGPTVRAWGEIGPCRFGDTCLSVSFAISGFPEPLPTTFLCVYPNSTRQFTFQGDGELNACLTGDEGDVVYIEVAGVRSGGVSAATLTP